MSFPARTGRRRPFAACAVVAAAALVVPAAAVADEHDGTAVPRLEQLDRGLVALTTGEGTFLSWRLLGSEVSAYTETGPEAPDFTVYRDGTPIGTVSDSTNFLDTAGVAGAQYTVAPVTGSETGQVSAPVGAVDGGFLTMPLQRPAGGVTPAGEAYTYSANDMSVGDVDGDGEYEFIVKWDPSNSKDVSQKGYTGNVYIDTYEMDGTLLHRIDLGVNIRAGAHYTQFLVYDFDGDGRAEMMFKTAPGTRTIGYSGGEPAGEDFITMPAEDLAAGYAHTDDYRMSAADYREHLTGMFLGWHEHPEVVAGSWPASIEAALGIAPAYDYPLSRADAEALVEHFISVWGDYAMSRIEPGNRVDRFLAGVAYLDGAEASAVFARGYYTRSTIVAYDWDGEALSERWFVDSGWTPMSNPFNDGPHGVPGTDPEFGLITTQGFHSLSAADVDGDGRQEIVYGSATIDDDGSLLYTSFDVLPSGSANPGVSAGLGHGDAMHVTDIDPDRPGLEIFTVHEGATWAPYGMAMRQAEDGEVIFGQYSGRDTGRGMIGDVVRDSRGIEVWGMGLHTPTGQPISGGSPGTNQSIRWAADMTTQIVGGSGNADVTVDDWELGRMLTAEGTRTNNGTKGNPGLVADVLGDWREELLVRTADSSAIRVYVSTELTDRKLHTLMHDPQYRAEVARQQTTYNQPSYTGFYLASDLDWENVPVPAYRYGADVEPSGPEVSVAADTRCVVGRVVETVRVTNESGAPAEVAISTPHGTRTLTVAADRATSVAFSTRLASVPAGEASVTASADGESGTVTAPYTARACG